MPSTDRRREPTARTLRERWFDAEPNVAARWPRPLPSTIEAALADRGAEAWETPMNRHWSDGENDAIVASYFVMLRADLAGERYSKAEHSRVPCGRLDRSEGSIRFKHQNISAVRKGLGEPWIDGYEPAFAAAIVGHIHPVWHEVALEDRQRRSVESTHRRMRRHATMRARGLVDWSGSPRVMEQGLRHAGRSKRPSQRPGPFGATPPIRSEVSAPTCGRSYDDERVGRIP